jgi:hypothetical protein
MNLPQKIVGQDGILRADCELAQTLSNRSDAPTNTRHGELPSAKGQGFLNT